MVDTVDRLEPPPRITGEPAADVIALTEYMWALYNNLILNKGVLQAVDQPQSTFDPTTGALSPFPIGFVLHTTREHDPATYLGYGTWERIAQGRVLVSIDESDSDFD